VWYLLACRQVPVRLAVFARALGHLQQAAELQGHLQFHRRRRQLLAAAKVRVVADLQPAERAEG